jgi:hypothetical protein
LNANSFLNHLGVGWATSINDDEFQITLRDGTDVGISFCTLGDQVASASKVWKSLCNLRLFGREGRAA